MNPFFSQIIIETIIRRQKKKNKLKTPSQIYKKKKDLLVEWDHGLWDAISILIGVLAAAFGLRGFLIPSSFIDGGVMGISLIASELSGISLSVLIVAINLPFIILAYTSIGKKFAIKSIIGIVLLSLAVHLIPFPVITDDKILVAAFGGLCLGLGIGMAIRGGAIIDGTEVLAIFISRKSSLTVGNVILIFNLLIFITAAYLLSTEIALYAILTYYAASKTIDFVIDGIEEFIGVTIISEHSEEIRRTITDVLGRGCTLYQGKRGYAVNGHPLKETQIVYTVITRLEMSKFQTEIDKIDKQAFVIMASVKDAKGGMIKKKPIKKIK